MANKRTPSSPSPKSIWMLLLAFAFVTLPIALASAQDVSTAATPSASPVGSPGAGTPAASPIPVGETFEASMKGLKFDPTNIEIAVGTTVTWTNDDTVAHTVTHNVAEGDRLFDSPLMAPGETFSHTFTEAGEFPFFCLPHPFMTGTIVVT